MSIMGSSRSRLRIMFSRAACLRMWKNTRIDFHVDSLRMSQGSTLSNTLRWRWKRCIRNSLHAALTHCLLWSQWNYAYPHWTKKLLVSLNEIKLGTHRRSHGTVSQLWCVLSWCWSRVFHCLVFVDIKMFTVKVESRRQRIKNGQQAPSSFNSLARSNTDTAEHSGLRPQDDQESKIVALQLWCLKYASC